MKSKDIVLPAYLCVLSIFWQLYPELYYKFGTAIIFFIDESIVPTRHSLPFALLVLSFAINAINFIAFDKNDIDVFTKKLINKKLTLSFKHRVYPIFISILQIICMLFVFSYTYHKYSEDIGIIKFIMLACISYYFAWAVFRLFAIMPFIKKYN